MNARQNTSDGDAALHSVLIIVIVSAICTLLGGVFWVLAGYGNTSPITWLLTGAIILPVVLTMIFVGLCVHAEYNSADSGDSSEEM
jgi:ABC-type spermidine/putrescine transport system permease subunit II